MDKLLYLLPVLACPIMMGTMMWFMMRGKNTTPTATETDRSTQDEIAMLRSQLANLRVQQHEQAGSTRGGTP